MRRVEWLRGVRRLEVLRISTIVSSQATVMSSILIKEMEIKQSQCSVAPDKTIIRA